MDRHASGSIRISSAGGTPDGSGPWTTWALLKERYRTCAANCSVTPSNPTVRQNKLSGSRSPTIGRASQTIIHAFPVASGRKCSRKAMAAIIGSGISRYVWTVSRRLGTLVSEGRQPSRSREWSFMCGHSVTLCVGSGDRKKEVRRNGARR